VQSPPESVPEEFDSITILTEHQVGKIVAQERVNGRAIAPAGKGISYPFRAVRVAKPNGVEFKSD
jgi:hypothetical protein